MLIREWQYTDNIEIAKIEMQVFEDFWSLKMLNDAFISNNFKGFVMTVDGVVVGYIGGTYFDIESEINLVAVKEEFRQQKIAYSLLNTYIEFMKSKGVKKVFLEVRRSNLVAQKLYEKLEFTYIGVRKNYYAGKEDALLMCKVIR